MSRRLELTGQKFNRLTVIEYVGQNDRNLSLWRCRCDCGNEIVRTGNAILQGHTKSCGCAKKCRHDVKKKKHGGSYDALYDVWVQMRRRCHNPKSSAYSYYGGRGISVCEEWRDEGTGYISFRAWALQNGYTKGLTIERVDVNGNYCPENCKWIPKARQSDNTRRTIWIEYNGEKHNLKQWSRILGMSDETIRYRYHRGLPVEEVLKKGHLR